MKSNFANVNALMASAPDWGNPDAPYVDRSNDVLVAAGPGFSGLGADRLRLSAADLDSEIAAAKAVLNGLNKQAGAASSAAASGKAAWLTAQAQATSNLYASGAGDIRETVTPIGFSITAPGFVPSEPLSMAAEAVQIAADSAIRAIAEVPLMAVDLAQVAGGVAYTEVTGKPADLTMYSGMGRAAQAGATMSESLHSLNPVYGLMVGGYEVQRGLEAGDTRPLAAFSGSLLGGAVAGRLTPQLPGYRPGLVSPGTANAARYIGNAARDVLGPRVEQWAYRSGVVNYVVPPGTDRTPNLVTGVGYDAGDLPVRIPGTWTANDLKQGLLGHPPRGLGRPDLHHGGQMPGAALHEVLPDDHRYNPALHMNKFNQGVTAGMRQSDRQLHWWYRAREQGADQLLPNWIYD